MIACGRRRWSRLAPAVGLAALLPAGLVDGAAARRGDDGGDRARAGRRRLRCGRRRPGRGACARPLGSDLPIALRRAPAGLAAVHRRGALRDPRHRAQPGHVPAPVRGRPAARRGERAADHPRAIRSGRTRSSSRSPRWGRAPCMRSTGSRWRSRWPRASRRSRCSSGLASWRRVAGALVVGLAYLVAVYLVQGAFKETIEALFVLAFAIGLGELARERPRVGAGAGRCAAAARPARDRQRLHLQLSGACSGSAARSPSGRRSSSGSPGVAAVSAPRARRPAPRCRRPPRPWSSSWSRSRPRSGGWSTSRTSRPSTRPATGSATCSTACRRSRRSGSGRPATSGSNPATARFRRSRSTRAAPPRWRRSPTGSPGGCAAGSARCPRRSSRRPRCGSMRCSAARPTRRPRRWC